MDTSIEALRQRVFMAQHKVTCAVPACFARRGGGCNMAARLSGLEPRYLAFKYTWNFDDMDVHRMS